MPLDPVIHQPTRLEIMTILFRNRQVSAVELREVLGLTAGNLASHSARLEEAGYVKSGRVLVRLSFEVHYLITEAGAAAFRGYLEALRALLREAEGPREPGPG